MAKFNLEVSGPARRDFDRLDRQVQTRIAAALRKLAENPRPRGCSQLEGVESVWRVVVGDWRIVYSINDKALVVLVVRLRHRREVYRRPR